MTAAGTSETWMLRLSCPDRPGIVAAVSGLLFDCGANIISSSQFEDPVMRRFFLRMEFTAERSVEDEFRKVAERFSMDWRLRSSRDWPRMAILVSRAGHCLSELLYRSSIGDLPAHIVAIIGNHPREDLEIRDLNDVQFHYLPITPETKLCQEAEIRRLLVENKVDLVVLARYMQVLSDDFCSAMPGRIINIHHSFLPGFKGAKPYHQAYERGVKLIGATAHYVTSELDEGPIIEQDVERVTHACSPESMASAGRDIERRVLNRAVSLHVNERVCLAGKRAIVL